MLEATDILAESIDPTNFFLPASLSFPPFLSFFFLSASKQAKGDNYPSSEREGLRRASNNCLDAYLPGLVWSSNES